MLFYVKKVHLFSYFFSFMYMFTADIPQSINIFLATYANNTAFLATSSNCNQVTKVL